MTLTASPRKPGTRKLSDLARRLVVPSGIVSTGWPSIERTSRNKLGVEFDDWQRGVGRVILSTRANGRLATTIDGVGMSLPRQVGKTYLLAAVLFALCIEKPGLLVIWSAHHARTHGETFLSMQGFAGRSKVAPYVRAVYTGSGDEEVRFRNGSRILFGARERGFGRGIPGVDILVFDEAQILSDRALANMLATLNVSKFGLHLYIGTPPRPIDDSESFRRMRDEATAGTLRDGAWVEFGAERGAHVDDRKQWARANPSFPERTPAESMLRLQRKLTADDFRREGLGIWDEELAGSYGLAQWAALDADVRPSGAPVFFVTIAPEMKSATIAVAAREGGIPHVELADHRQGTAWLAGRLRELHTSYPGSGFAAWQSGPVKAWAPTLAETGLELRLLPATEVVSAYAHLRQLSEAKTLTHSADPLMSDALLSTVWKDTDGGGAIPDWRKSTGDISPLVAAVGALWLLESYPDYDLSQSFY